MSLHYRLIRYPGTTPAPSHPVVDGHGEEVCMSWFILVLAGLAEIGWAVGLEYTEGFTRLWPSVGTVTIMVVSLGLLSIAMKSLPIGVAYAVWTGIGIVGTAIGGAV